MWRLIIAALLFLISFLVLIKAPTNFFWKVAVAVTEFPYIPVLLSLLFFCLCLKTQAYRWPVLVMTGAALIIYMLPVIQAYARGAKLGEFNKAFPAATMERPLELPFSLIKQFSGIGIQEIKPAIYTYKKTPGRDLNIDFYPASRSGRRPCVVVIHGGSWSSGDSKQLPALNSYLANRGMHVAAINYRLAPAYRFPAPVEDTKEALAYLKAHADSLHIDTANFVLLGRSAGAQIALLAAYTFNDPCMKGVVSFYGPADMAWGATIKTNKLVLDVDKVFSEYLGGLIAEVPKVYEESSACHFVAPQSPPTLLIHGPNDALVSYNHSIRLEKTLNEKGVRHYFLNLPWATHGCDYNINGPSGQLSTYAVERFINSVTSPH
jgi:acetyl esterase/lipase